MDIKILYWASAILLWIFMIYNHIKNKNLRKKLNKYNSDFIKKLEKDYDDFTTLFNERANLLSRENNKLRAENENLKERLRDLGITYFD
jgi:hypothetical protein